MQRPLRTDSTTRGTALASVIQARLASGWVPSKAAPSFPVRVLSRNRREADGPMSVLFQRYFSTSTSSEPSWVAPKKA